MIFISSAMCITIVFFQAVMPNLMHIAFSEIVTKLKQKHVDSTVSRGMFRTAEEDFHPP